LNTNDFSSLDLSPELIKSLTSLGYKTLTPIQEQSLPHILAGKDVIAQAKTGSGKTTAFGLGIIAKLDVKRFRIQALVLCPTRELADQVAQEIRILARTIHNIKILTLCGGMPFGPQVGSLEYGAHIIIGTPGRVLAHLEKSTLSVTNLTTLVLDEADRMLEMGFQRDIDAIISRLPKNRQTLLLSATYPEQIEVMAKRTLSKPTMVQIDMTHQDSDIEQFFYKINDENQRITALRLLLLHHSPTSALIFCNTKLETQKVADALADYGFSTIALHGDLEQRDRTERLVKFSNNSISVLVATDVAARGLHIDDIGLIINYHLARNVDVHIHRIGRTGRAGKTGIACSLYNEKDSYKIKFLNDALNKQITSDELPPLSTLKNDIAPPLMVTLLVDKGKKQKIRPGDILGAITANNLIQGSEVGDIKIQDNYTFVAVHHAVIKEAITQLTQGTLKGKPCRVKRLNYT